MAGSYTDYTENKVLELIVGKTGFSTPTIHLALFTVAPTDSTTGTEVSGGSYARKATSGTDWAAASGGSISNSAELTFVTPTASWGTIVAWGAFDALTTGNLLWYSDQTPNKTVNTGDPVKFAVGALTITQT